METGLALPRDFCRLDPHEAFVAPLLLPSLRDRLLAAAAFAKINILLLPRKQVTHSAALLGFAFFHGRNMCPAEWAFVGIISRTAKAKVRRRR